MILTTRQLLLNLLLRTIPAGWTRPVANNSLEWCLYSTVPDDSGAGGVECVGGGYAAIAVTALDANIALASDVASNVAAVQFPAGATPLTAGITVAGWGLRTTAGTILWAQPAAGLPINFTWDGATDTGTSAAHGILTQQPVRLVALSPIPLPGGAVDTTYFANAPTVNTLKVYDTLANAIAGGATGLVDMANGACAVRKYYGGTFSINDRAVIPAGEFRMQLAAPLR